jgi:hypothetical protein
MIQDGDMGPSMGKTGSMRFEVMNSVEWIIVVLHHLCVFMGEDIISSN